METRALAIALFYAVGTAIGGITGPLLFGHLIESGSADQVATGFFIGAAAMALGGVAELLFGVRAEGKSLEDIAKPLTAEEAEAEFGSRQAGAPAAAAPPARAARSRDLRGLRRFRPGPGTSFYSPGMVGTAGASSRYRAMAAADRVREIEAIAVIVAEGPLTRDELARRVRGDGWGPGRFRAALRDAVEDGRAGRLADGTYGRAP
jgi:hypothetical protein